ncbi:actin-like ATPase domain-containing [Fusarium albosuccineum]|uniref:Actin-like ATPase domain-containing n=1 Tax=Fusarium albosuccineum TaxID=1237068 RepID=A0A8H4P9V6_9HYPO|nr:actin-like ATPase domain-containing [Fusarium albosuccineum]
MDFDDTYTAPVGEEPRFILCFDYGTTFTGVAWALRNGRDQPTLNDIHVVNNWSPDYVQDKVHSLYTYSPDQGQRWGWDIESNQYVIRRPKLELPEPSPINALKKLKRTVQYAQILHDAIREGAQPPVHVTKSPFDVTKDYLSEVALAARKSIEASRPPHQLRDFPIDIVVTHPVQWDERAKNLTWKAVHAAFRYGFPRSTLGVARLTTESEACAQYTLEAAKVEDIMDIQEGQCFVVVDAGGGTVDLVSYLVTSLSPFEPTRIENVDVTGDGCGATRIDDYFLFEYLPQVLREEYQLLAPGVLDGRDHSGSQVVLSKGLQTILRRFEVIKQRFAGPQAQGQPEHYEVLDLPDGFGNRNEPSRGIRDGQLLISSTALKYMFDLSVSKILDLVRYQLTMVESEGHRAAAIFLSGGFSESPYLRSRVKDWAAVARGGVIMGLGDGLEHRQAPICLSSPYHVGAVLAERWAEFAHDQEQRYSDTYDGLLRANKNIKWLVSKGDLINGQRFVRQRIVKKLAKRSNLAGRLLVVFDSWDYVGGQNADGPPTSLEETTKVVGGRIGRGTRQIVPIDYDLPEPQKSQWTSGGSEGYYQIDLDLEITINQNNTTIELLSGGRAQFGDAGRSLKIHHHPFNTSATDSYV